MNNTSVLKWDEIKKADARLNCYTHIFLRPIHKEQPEYKEQLPSNLSKAQKIKLLSKNQY